MSKLTPQEKQNVYKYRREFLPPMLFYMGWVFAVPYLLDYVGDGIWTIPLAVSQIVPLMFVARAIIRFIERSDELMQKLSLKAAAMTLIIITFFCMGYGFLEIRDYPHIPLFLIGTAIIPIYFLSLKFYKWRL